MRGFWLAVGFIALLLPLTAGCSGTDGEENTTNNSRQCETPAGTYTISLSATDGNCPSDLVSDITALQQDITLDEPKQCGAVSVSDSDQVDQNCTITGTFEFEATDTGLDNGTYEIDADCSNTTCSHSFNAYFERRQ